MKKDNVISTFIDRGDQLSIDIDPEAKVFSIPYDRILQAQNFCKSEEMSHCYVGYRDFMWLIQPTTENIEPSVKVTAAGLDQIEKDRYLITTSEIS